MIRHSILSVRCESDLLLHHLAAIGLAAARGTALLVDLDGASPPYPGTITVADLVGDGVHRDHLGPSRKGVAVLPNGGADPERALELVEALRQGWPALVVRIGRLATSPYPHVPVVPALPVPLGPSESGRYVRQRLRRRRPPRGDGVDLPVLRRGQVWAMVEGRVDARSAWVKAWRPVWDLPWG